MKIRVAALLLAMCLFSSVAMAAPKAHSAPTPTQSVGDDGTDYGWGIIADLINKLLEKAINR